MLYGSTAGGSLRSDWRKIEDKLVNNCRIELRNFVVNLDMQDSTLPNKGTAHRALRSGGDPAPAQVNVLLGVETVCVLIPLDVSQN